MNLPDRLPRYAYCIVLLCMLSSSRAAFGQVTGFLVTTEDLWERDLETLVSTNVGPTGSIASAGLAMRSDGTLFSVSDFTDDLWQVDPSTGAGVLIGSLGLDVHVGSGLTFDACGGLWMATGGSLFEVDPDTASTSLVADFGDRIVALTAKGDQLLALVGVGTPSQLAWIDPEEGTLDLFGDLVFLPTFQVGLDFDSDGGLWALYWMDGPIPGPWVSSIVNYDSSTGQVLGIAGDIGPPLAGNLAISPPQGVCGDVLAVPASTPSSLAVLFLLLITSGLVLVSRMR